MPATRDEILTLFNVDHRNLPLLGLYLKSLAVGPSMCAEGFLTYTQENTKKNDKERKRKQREMERERDRCKVIFHFRIVGTYWYLRKVL